MHRRVLGAAVVRDHPGKQLDSVEPAAAPETVAVEAEELNTESFYDAFPDTAPGHDQSTGPAEPPAAALPPAEPVHSRPMRARLGLSVGLFVAGRDTDFLRWDSLYLVATQESIEERLNCQCTSLALRGALLRELLPGHAALREYPGRCPPPAAYAPIRLPMRDDAKPIFTVQHTLSDTARKCRDRVIEERMSCGIDKPSTPCTEERRVLFDDSANNSLNMRAVGMQLPTPLERMLFLRDAKLLSSVDMASFFTQLWLHEDVADYWTFDCGQLGKVRTRRMVQGNSESPAIAQAFLLRVLSGAPSLRDKMLVYIDNIYLKSVSGDEQKHIEDIGVFVRVLAETNVTVNMRKSLWVATRGVEVLGHEWSANGDWKPFDHRVCCIIM
ncbi:hypothetical protein GGH96_001823 [Coemansia sp. RSA 1972]|nr:hypothetical protein GGH96_001823 [Coemansia sp. RSA 1972]